MRLFRGLHNIRPIAQGCVLTIGNFDGVHLGHQRVLNTLKDQAAELNLPAAVMVFEPQPKEFFNADEAPARLTTLAEKLELFKQHDIDAIACMAFNPRFRGLSAQQFVEDVLVKGLNVKALIVGDDFRFGCDRSGDFAFLEKAGKEFGFSVTDTQTLQAEGQRVSSTLIRTHLDLGDVEGAAPLLGREYSISGRIAHGQKLGRQLGFPTANTLLKRGKAPLKGVFAVQVTNELNDEIYQGVANIGMRPTVGGTRAVLETHIFDFSGDLYGKRLSVRFKHKIRDEKRFDGLEALKAAIHNDIQQAKAYFASC